MTKYDAASKAKPSTKPKVSPKANGPTAATFPAVTLAPSELRALDKQQAVIDDTALRLEMLRRAYAEFWLELRRRYGLEPDVPLNLNKETGEVRRG